MYAHTGDLNKAIDDFTDAIELNPNDFYYRQRGLAYTYTGDLDKAIDDFKHAIELDPDDPNSYLFRGIIFSGTDQVLQARQDYEKAIELAPEWVWPWYGLCLHGSLLEEAANVLDACNQAIEIDPDFGLFRDGRGLARALTGDYTGAIEDFKSFLEWSQNDSDFGEWRPQREAWIVALEAGQNPFDEATLDTLRQDFIKDFFGE